MYMRSQPINIQSQYDPKVLKAVFTSSIEGHNLPYIYGKDSPYISRRTSHQPLPVDPSIFSPGC